MASKRERHEELHQDWQLENILPFQHSFQDHCPERSQSPHQCD